MKLLHVFTLAALLMICGNLFAAVTPTTAPAPAVGAKSDEGLTATLVVNKDSYVLNPTQSGKDFRDKVEGMRKGPGIPPKPPAVDLVLRLTNTTDKAVTISVGGDISNVSLKLTGPGAIMIQPNVAMTMEFRAGKPLSIPAGKTADIKITSLSNGQRGIAEYNYWTEPGEYTLVATLTYGVNNDEKQGKVTSGPARLKVTAAEK